MTSINNTLNNLLNEKIKIIPNSPLSIDKYINDQKNNIKLISKIEQRKKILLSLKKFLLKNKKYFIKLINLEVYKTIDESKGEFDYAIEFIDYSLTTLKNYKFEKKIKYFLICLILNFSFIFAIFLTFPNLDFMLRLALDRLLFQTSGLYLILVVTLMNNLRLFKNNLN